MHVYHCANVSTVCMCVNGVCNVLYEVQMVDALFCNKILLIIVLLQITYLID